MYNIKIGEQIGFLRRQKNMTQEYLANTIGVTNQAVSKWESGQCCPDIQLLPEIASLFGVSIDELMGYNYLDTFENIYLKIKSLFQSFPEEDVFDKVFRLAALLHEAVCTRGYKSYVPWDTEKNYSLEEDTIYKEGSSKISEPGGSTVYTGSGIFFADSKKYKSSEITKITEIYLFLEKLADINILKIMYAIYELTNKDFNLYVSLSNVAEKANISENDTAKAVKNFPLPLTVKESGDGELMFRIEGPYMYIPSLLLLLR